MINAMGEASMQQLVRTSSNAEMLAKDQEVKKVEKIKELRPIEKSDDGHKSEMDLRSRDNMTTRNSFVNGQLIVEQYDENGKLVKKRLPGIFPWERWHNQRVKHQICPRNRAPTPADVDSQGNCQIFLA